MGSCVSERPYTLFRVTSFAWGHFSAGQLKGQLNIFVETGLTGGRLVLSLLQGNSDTLMTAVPH